jgi:hypothetical protein
MPSDIEQLERKIREHHHDGVEATQIYDFDIFGEIPSRINTDGQTIATTGNTDWYIIAPISGRLESADFSGTDALAANDTNYITFTITNLGRAGSGTTAMLGTDTTQATGGTAISANTVRELKLSTATNAGVVVAGDRLRIRAAATNTLANTVTYSVFCLRFK